MAEKLQAIRGMNDILPTDSHRWQWLESTVISVVQQYGYQQIRTPLLEQTDLFCRSIGEVTDIVEKEMYTFADREKRSLSLRPEGTASVVRAGNQHGLFHNQIQRLWYVGPMFRHERPQRGRLRQFHQIGVEAFGIAEADIDAELILLTARLWQALGIRSVKLELNTLGSSKARAAYRQVLIDYFAEHPDQLDEDSKRRLGSNPLRILDSKNPDMQALIADAPQLPDHIDPESREHFAQLCERLDDAGVEYTLNPRLVRGLDYYSRTVFEWTTDKLGAQGAVCAGGRYDALVEQLGGKPVPAIGFAMGIERLLELLIEDDVEIAEPGADIYIVVVGDAARRQGQKIAEKLRSDGRWKVILNADERSFKAQLKRADKSGAAFAVILGESEVENGSALLKPLRTAAEQLEVAQNALGTVITESLVGA